MPIATTSEVIMTTAEALKRALRAIEKAYRDSEQFDHGGLASHEIMDDLKKALQAEFAQPSPNPAKGD